MAIAAAAAAISVIALLGISTLHTSAQQNQSVTTNTYQNDEYGFAIDYPANWQIEDTSSSGLEDRIITVQSPESESTPVGLARTQFSVDAHNVSTSLDPNTLQVKSASAQDYAVSEMNVLNALGSDILPITQEFVKNAATSMSNGTENNAWRLDYITYLGGQQSIFTVKIFVVKDKELYELAFATEPLKVPEILPIGEKTIQSFRFI